jgi:tetratricopeptide (TPR) repeat protein
MSAIWQWVVDLFTSGAILILALYLSAPVFHLLQSSREKRRLFRRMAAGKLNPQGFETRLELGEIYVRARRWRKAIEELEKAVEIDADHAHCRSLFGSALFHDCRYQEAVDNMEKALEIRPTEGYGRTQVFLGRGYEALGNSEKAIEWYRAATLRNTSICEPGYRLALVFKKEGNLDDYRTQLREVVKRFSAFDRTNYWKNLWFVLRARMRLALGV